MRRLRSHRDVPPRELGHEAQRHHDTPPHDPRRVIEHSYAPVRAKFFAHDQADGLASSQSRRPSATGRTTGRLRRGARRWAASEPAPGCPDAQRRGAALRRRRLGASRDLPMSAFEVAAPRKAIKWLSTSLLNLRLRPAAPVLLRQPRHVRRGVGSVVRGRMGDKDTWLFGSWDGRVAGGGAGAPAGYKGHPLSAYRAIALRNRRLRPRRHRRSGVYLATASLSKRRSR